MQLTHFVWVSALFPIFWIVSSSSASAAAISEAISFYGQSGGLPIGGVNGV